MANLFLLMVWIAYLLLYEQTSGNFGLRKIIRDAGLTVDEFSETMIQEHERAILTVGIPETQLRAGDAAYEVEFFALDVVTVEVHQVRLVSRSER